MRAVREIIKFIFYQSRSSLSGFPTISLGKERVFGHLPVLPFPRRYNGFLGGKGESPDRGAVDSLGNTSRTSPLSTLDPCPSKVGSGFLSHSSSVGSTFSPSKSFGHTPSTHPRTPVSLPVLKHLGPSQSRGKLPTTFGPTVPESSGVPRTVP